MPSVYIVRAEFGKYLTHFVRGGYVGIGLLPTFDFSAVNNRDELFETYEREHPARANDLVIGRQLGQMERFLLGIKAGDYVITPDADTRMVHYGIIEPNPSYYYFESVDGCSFPHRRRVRWNRKGIEENDFSVPFQRAVRSPQVVFRVSAEQNFLTVTPEKIWFQETASR
ncbi:MAG: hypothetical protein LH614_02780 [Pyrinomonadaceae bacterium]|nr:hypothetical protein [Pyrinomonadaceae bacterium]